MSSVDETIIGKLLDLGVSKSDAQVIVRGLSAVEKSRALRNAAFLQDICKSVVPAGPVPVPYPNVGGAADAADGSKKVKIDAEEVSLGERSSFEPSAGDEAGTRGVGEVSKVKGRVLSEARGLVDYVGEMGPAGYKVLALTLAIGLVSGYGAGLIPYNSMKNSGLARIAELEETVSGQESALVEYQDQNQELTKRVDEMEGELEIQGAVIEGYEETSLELQGRVEELEDRVAYQNSTIGILRGSLSDAEGQIQIYIDEVRVDAGNGRILVLIRNPSSLNAAVSCLALYTDSVSYRDYSEDATGIIPGGEAIELVWSEVDASAPSGYVDDGSDYLVMATTVTGYSDWHLYRVVEMGILVSRWRISDDEISVSIRNGNLHVPFPSVEVIGVGKVGPKGPGVLYNVTDPYLVEEGTIGGGTYTWNESAASAPENFLRYGSEFVIRVTYGAEEEWYTWDRGYSQVTVASPSVERETSGGEGGEW